VVSPTPDNRDCFMKSIAKSGYPSLKMRYIKLYIADFIHYFGAQHSGNPLSFPDLGHRMTLIPYPSGGKAYEMNRFTRLKEYARRTTSGRRMRIKIADTKDSG
jgi:hypothetical protein